MPEVLRMLEWMIRTSNSYCCLSDKYDLMIETSYTKELKVVSFFCEERKHLFDQRLRQLHHIYPKLRIWRIVYNTQNLQRIIFYPQIHVDSRKWKFHLLNECFHTELFQIATRNNILLKSNGSCLHKMDFLSLE